MAEHLENVFFSSETPELYHEIIENSDLENLLVEQHAQQAARSSEIPKLELKAFKAPTIPRKIQKKNTVAIKVTSLGKIRKTFEADQAEKLSEILELSENLINMCLKKKSDRERLMNKGIIKSLLMKGHPLSRASLKCLAQFNLHDFKYVQQSIRVNGKPITLSGGLGGNIPEIDYDMINLNPNKVTSRRSSDSVKSPNKDREGAQLAQIGKTKHRGILACPNIKFKPGPLSKKPVLSKSASHTIHGPLELIRVPAVGLEVFPRVGMKLDSAACFHLGNVRRQDGRIDADWAQFAASLVEQPTTAETKQSHTFILPYENNQNRILMQKDLDFTEKFISKSGNHNLSPIKDFTCLDELTNINSLKISGKIDIAVKNVLSDLINTVAIGEVQDRIWKYDEDYKPVEVENTETKTEKKKGTKRKFNELRRLDVTVIDVDNGKTQGEEEACTKLSCKLGCVCSSLRACFLMNEHCGKAECMFKCSCKLEVSKSAVVNLQNQLNRHLCREEQKFKRTVIHSNDETLVLGASRRGLRVPKKFEDFYFPNQFDAKVKTTSQKDVKIVCAKLPNDLKLSPWCMVHQLYMCFCKGLFTEGSEYKYSYASATFNDGNSENITTVHIDEDLFDDDDSDDYAVEETADTFCSRRTTFNEQFIKRSKKCAHKYLERNSRIKWAEREDVGKMRILKSHMEHAFKVFNEGKDFITAEPSSRPQRRKNKSTIPSLPNTSDFSNPTSNNIVRNWCKLIEDYCNQKVFIWATAQPPLKIYITSTSNIYSKSVCIPIPVGKDIDENLLNSHNPMLREIVNKNVSAHKQVLLTRKPYAWELCGSAVQENITETILKHPSLDTPKQTELKTSKNLFTWPRIPETPKQMSGDLKIENTSTSNEIGKRPKVVPSEDVPVQLNKNVLTANKSRVKSITLKSSHKLFKKIKFSSQDLDSMDSKPTSVSPEGSQHKNGDKPQAPSTTIPLLENFSVASNEIKSRALMHEMKTASLVPKKLQFSLSTLKKSTTTLPELLEEDFLKPELDNTSSLKLTPKNASPLLQVEREPHSQIPGKLTVSKNTCPLQSKPKENSSVTPDQKKSLILSEKQDPLIPDKSETSMITKKVADSNKPPLPKLSIPTLKISANQLRKLPTTVTGPLVTDDPKYRWLLLYLEDDLTGMTVIFKNFSVTRQEVIEAMSLAEKSGKTCKFPVSRGSPQSSVPGFGIYAVPGNRMKEIFLGPYRHDEKMGLKILVKKNNNLGKRTWGKWTKTLNKANVIVCDRDKDIFTNPANDNAPKPNSSDNTHKVNTVVVIDPSSTLNIGKIPIDLPEGRSLLRKTKTYTKRAPDADLPVRDTHKNIFGKEPTTVNPVNPTSMLSKANLENISKIFQKKLTALKDKPIESKIANTPPKNNLADKTPDCSPEKKDEESTDGEDDVIFLPTKTEIVEILDSDDDDTPSNPKPSQVWFLCTNIPLIGYIAATQKPNGTIVLKFDHLGPIECSNPTTAMVSINMLLTNYVGFDPKDLTCCWDFVKCAAEVQNLKPLDEAKLNNYHIITKDGLVATGLGKKERTSGSSNRKTS